MTNQTGPCTLNASTSAPGTFCEACDHNSLLHPGAGWAGGGVCLICATEELNDALSRKEAQLEALKHELEWELMQVKAMTSHTRSGTWVPTLAHGDVFVP